MPYLKYYHYTEIFQNCYRWLLFHRRRKIAVLPWFARILCLSLSFLRFVWFSDITLYLCYYDERRRNTVCSRRVCCTWAATVDAYSVGFWRFISHGWVSLLFFGLIIINFCLIVILISMIQLWSSAASCVFGFLELSDKSILLLHAEKCVERAKKRAHSLQTVMLIWLRVPWTIWTLFKMNIQVLMLLN